jgi:hypothetical protein
MGLRDNIKQWFQTRNTPTEAQFYSFFDSIFFKDDGLGIGDITNLTTTLNGKASTDSVNTLAAAVIPDHVNPAPNSNCTDTYHGVRADGMIIIPSVNMTIRIGTANGLDDIVPDVDIVAGVENVIDFKISALLADKTIYVNGLTAIAQVYMYKR